MSARTNHSGCRVPWWATATLLGMLALPRQASAITLPTGSCTPSDVNGCWKIINGGTSTGISVRTNAARPIAAQSALGCGVTGTSGSGTGLYGSSTSGEGVYGFDDSNVGFSVGVEGTSTSGSGVGVYGSSPHIGVLGVVGSSDGPAPGFAGLQGYSPNTNGLGVTGRATGNLAYGLHALCSNDCATSPDGLAGNFSGNVTITAWTNGGSALVVSAGNAYKPGGGGWTVISDARVKQDVAGFSRGYDDLARVQPVLFKYNGLGGTTDNGTDYAGVIAQDLEKFLPTMVSSTAGKLRAGDRSETQIKHVDGSDFIYMLINAVNDQKRMIESREARIARLERARNPLSSRRFGVGLALGLAPLGFILARSLRKGA